jgi:anti-anti-sigma regulatory factor
MGDVLHDLIDNQGNLSVMVDLKDVTVGDSGWIDVLAMAADAALSRGGELSLSHPPHELNWPPTRAERLQRYAPG